MIKVPIEISARHLHLSQVDLEKLFGNNYKLKKKKDLTQTEEFAAEETVDVQNGEKRIKSVRIVGPVRPITQLEISATDAFILGVRVPARRSGEIKGTPGITLVGRKGKIKMKEGAIIPLRHIHIGEKKARECGLKNRQLVSVAVEGERAVVFQKVRVRVGKNYIFCLHLDTDEGNAAGINMKGEGKIL